MQDLLRLLCLLLLRTGRNSRKLALYGMMFCVYRPSNKGLHMVFNGLLSRQSDTACIHRLQNKTFILYAESSKLIHLIPVKLVNPNMATICPPWLSTPDSSSICISKAFNIYGHWEDSFVYRDLIFSIQFFQFKLFIHITERYLNTNQYIVLYRQ